MPKRLPRSRTLKGDPKLAYYDSGGGTPGEAAILLLHASTFRAEDWENVFPRLATRYRVIAYDARGHGKSGRTTAYGLSEMADDAERVLREVVKAPAVLIGHAGGALAAMIVAARSPELTRGVVLEEPPLYAHGRPWQDAFASELRRALDKRDDPPAFRRAVAQLPLDIPGPRGERRIGDVRGFYGPDRCATYYQDVDPAFVDSRIADGDPRGRLLLDESLPKLKVPALLVLGDPKAGGTLSVEQGSGLERTMQTATLVRFPGVGHRVHGLRPEPFLEALEPFLRKVRGS